MLCYSLPWISNTQQMDVTAADWGRLSERGKRIMSRTNHI